MIVLKLAGNDGSSVDFQASGVRVLGDYSPMPSAAMGSEVTETFDISISGTAAERTAVLRSIHQIFYMAQQSQDWDQAFLQYAPDESSTVFQAKILRGQVALRNMTRRWANERIKATVMITRQGFWEAASWTQVSLTNANGTAVTTALRVYNTDDRSGSSPNVRNCYVATATTIAGDLPAATKLTISAAQAINGLYIGQGTRAPVLLESEDWTSMVGASQLGDSAASGGDYFFGDDPGSAYTDLAYILHNFADYANGWWRPVMRTFSAPGDGVMAKIRQRKYGISTYTTDYVMGESAAVLLDGDRVLHPLGLMRIPPFPAVLSGDHTYYNIYLDLVAKSSASPIVDLLMDGVHLVPADSYLEVGRDDSEYVIANSTIIETSDLERVSHITGVADLYGASPFWNIHSGTGIFLKPGETNYINFLMRYVDAAPITYNATVKLHYKARVMSL